MWKQMCNIAFKTIIKSRISSNRDSMNFIVLVAHMKLILNVSIWKRRLGYEIECYD